MADEAQGTAAPATPTEQTPAASEKPRVQASELSPDTLKSRLESAKDAARREMLAELGASDPKDIKAALAELKARQDAEKTELDKANARVKDLENKAALADSYGSVIANRASAEVAALNEKTRAFVTAEAGNDPAKQLAVIDRMRASGMLDTAPAAATTAASAPAAAAAPAVITTAPARNAPAEAGTVATADVRQTFERLRDENPFAAAAFAERNAGALFVKPNP